MQQTQLPQRIADAAGQSKRGPRWWRTVPYGFIATLAIAGQYLALVERLHPVNNVARAGILSVALGIEGMAVWLAYLADTRGRLGERALPYRVISALFATLAFAINIVGHYPDVYLMVVFGGFSVAGYTVWCIESISALRDFWDADGSIRSRVPAYGLLKNYEKDPRVIKRARLIAQTHAEAHPDAPGLGPVSALAQAREELSVEARRATLQKVIREQYKLAGLPPIDIEMALLAYGTEEVAASLIKDANNSGLASALLHIVRPQRLLGMDEGTWDKVAGQPGDSADRPARVPMFPGARPARPKGRQRVSHGTDVKARRLDEAYRRHVDETGVPPTVRDLADLADVPKSTTGRWMQRLNGSAR